MRSLFILLIMLGSHSPGCLTRATPWQRVFIANFSPLSVLIDYLSRPVRPPAAPLQHHHHHQRSTCAPPIFHLIPRCSQPQTASGRADRAKFGAGSDEWGDEGEEKCKVVGGLPNSLYVASFTCSSTSYTSSKDIIHNFLGFFYTLNFVPLFLLH